MGPIRTARRLSLGGGRKGAGQRDAGRTDRAGARFSRGRRGGSRGFGVRQARFEELATYLREHGAWAKGIEKMAATAAQFLVATDGLVLDAFAGPAAWPPTLAWSPSLATPDASPAITTGPSATAGHCARSST